MRKLTKWFIAGVLCILMGTNVFAADYEIDGDFSDWDKIQAVDTSGNSIFFSKIATAVDDENLYIYAVEKSTNSWENYFSYANPILVDENGNEFPLVITEKTRIYGNTAGLVIRRQNGWSILQGAEGVRTKNKTYEWEIKIPLKEFGSIRECKIMMDYANYVSFKPAKIQQGENESVQETTVQETSMQETTPEMGTVGKPSSAGIAIDGYFDDWKDYPHAFVTNWDMPDSIRNETNCRQLSLIHDSEYLYMHVKMLSGWYDPFNGNEYYITANGKTVSINLRTEGNGPLPETHVSNGIHTLNVFYKNKTGSFDDDKLISNAEAKLTVLPGKPDEAEIKIPLSVFKELYGMNIDDIKEITVKNPNLFIDKVVSAGSSTGPIFGVVLCLITVIGSLTVVKYKKRKMNVKEQ